MSTVQITAQNLNKFYFFSWGYFYGAGYFALFNRIEALTP